MPSQFDILCLLVNLMNYQWLKGWQVLVDNIVLVLTQVYIAQKSNSVLYNCKTFLDGMIILWKKYFGTISLSVFLIAQWKKLISSIIEYTSWWKEAPWKLSQLLAPEHNKMTLPLLINPQWSIAVRHDNFKSLFKVIPLKFWTTDFFALTLLHFCVKVLKAVDELNKDSTIHGIIVQLPPDSVEPIDPAICTNAVAPEKDVDG